MLALLDALTGVTGVVFVGVALVVAIAAGGRTDFSLRIAAIRAELDVDEITGAHLAGATPSFSVLLRVYVPYATRPLLITRGCGECTPTSADLPPTAISDRATAPLRSAIQLSRGLICMVEILQLTVGSTLGGALTLLPALILGPALLHVIKLSCEVGCIDLNGSTPLSLKLPERGQ